MKIVWTTEHERKIEHCMIGSFDLFKIGFVLVVIMMGFTLFSPEHFKSFIVYFADKIIYLLATWSLICFFLYKIIKKKVDPKGEGKKLKEELGIQRLDFRRLSDKSYEMHHHPYKSKEIEEMIQKGLSTDEITMKWKKQLEHDFKRLESFIREKELKGESVVIHTYTHIRMYKTWIKIARDAGVFFEVIKDSNQKPVGFKWREWKKVVYRTSGKKAIKDSIPKANEWSKYVLTSRDQ